MSLALAIIKLCFSEGNSWSVGRSIGQSVGQSVSRSVRLSANNSVKQEILKIFTHQLSARVYG